MIQFHQFSDKILVNLELRQENFAFEVR